MNTFSETLQQTANDSSVKEVSINVNLNSLSNFFINTDKGTSGDRLDAINFAYPNGANLNTSPRYNLYLIADREYKFTLNKTKDEDFKSTCEELEIESIKLNFLNRDQSNLHWENLLVLDKPLLTDKNNTLTIKPKIGENEISFKVKQEELVKDSIEFKQNIEYDIYFKYKFINNGKTTTKYGIIDPFISHTTGDDPKYLELKS